MEKYRLKKRIISIIIALALILALIPNMSCGNMKEVNAAGQASDVVNIALGELGYVEGANDYTKYGVEFGAPNAQWCAIFIWWCS